ncbi:MAG: group II intron reverse transcriptase/maturase [Verrucomicrobiales bacterium]|nr:group II intron reverse transcriptase/maturase [Verrucomicrobiales bacterium]
MMEQILDRENLAQAWKRVKANKGAPGIDGMTVDAFPAFCREHWERISQALMKGTYRPASVRRVWLPKPDGTMRPLGVPTVLDRLIQQAMAQVLGRLFEGDFSAHSYGFRPGRSAHQAVAELELCWKARRRYAVDCDLKSFFDTVNHDHLMEALRKKVKCPRTLGLIRRYLTAGVVLPDGTRDATLQGVPQGGPLSPLLANIVLDPLDKELEARGHRFARYADDFIVMVKSARAAQRVMASLIRFCEGRLKLVVNRAKSQAAPLQSCAFLGYQVGKRGKLMWTFEAVHRFKQRVRDITRRNRGHRVQDVIGELRRYVIGWLNYFKLSHTYTVVLELDRWLRRRVRLYYWKQWKQPRTRRRNLISLGIAPDRVKLASRSRKGYWRMSQNSIVRTALNNHWLNEQGVPDIRVTWINVALAALAPSGSLPAGCLAGARLTTGQVPASDRNRRIRTRMSGGVGPVAGLSQSRGPDSLPLLSRASDPRHSPIPS